jgi:hypothetical protein
MTVAVRGRVPRDPEKQYTGAFNNIEARLLALERDNAGGAPLYTSPSTPLFGGGSSGAAPGSGGGSGGSGSGGGTTTVTITETASLQDTFLMMGA